MVDHLHISFRERLLAKCGSAVRRINEKSQNIQDRRSLSHLKSCGKGVGVWGRFKVTCPERMEVGDNVHFGDNAFIRAEGGLTIGDNTHISRNLVLYTINHQAEGERVPYDDQMVAKPVKIGRNVWIGMNVCIAPGTSIGDGAIVGMGTVAFGDVPPMSVIGNPPWRVIGQRDQARYQRLEGDRAYGGPNGSLL